MRLLWSQKVAAPVRGLALARERGWALAWDAQDSLHLWDRAGRPQAHFQAPAPLAGIVAADDGSVFAAAGGEGQVWLLTPDLVPRPHRGPSGRISALALAPLGNYLAIATAAGGAGGALHLLDPTGKEQWKVATPLALKHLAFVPERPVLAVSAEFGLVACFGPEGKMLWRDGLVARVGSLAVSGDGSRIVLACFTDGLHSYAVERGRSQPLAQIGACHLAAISYDGNTLLTAGLENQVSLRDRDGTIQGSYSASSPVVALALSPLADYAVVALANGSVVGLASRVAEAPAGGKRPDG